MGLNWSPKLEYSYMDFGSQVVNFRTGVRPYENEQSVQVLKAGINSALAPSLADIEPLPLTTQDIINALDRAIMDEKRPNPPPVRQPEKVPWRSGAIAKLESSRRRS